MASVEIPIVALITDNKMGVEKGNNSMGIIISLFFERNVILHIMFPIADKNKLTPRLSTKIKI